MTEGPFFIVGSPRSGTTLLRFMLASHPRLWIPSETGFIPFLRVSPDHGLDRSDRARVCHRIARLNREWSADAAGIREALEDGSDVRLGELLDSLYRARMAGSGAARWGDKTPGYLEHIPTIARIFPSCRFIHLIRDGRDVTLSATAKWRHRFPERLYMDGHYLIRSWARAVTMGRRAGAELGASAYLELRYEELVRNPETSLRQACAFLGEDFHPDMLQHEALARRVISPAGHVEVREAVSTASVERWRREMTPAAQWKAERAVGRTLEKLGYELAAPCPPSLMTRLSYASESTRYRATRIVQRALDLAGVARLNRGKRRRRPESASMGVR
jgi:hypothetical protein